jgi:folate-binding protein YgfZ
MLIPLHSYGLLTLSGTKARAFMHGQSTPELLDMESDQIAYGACCDPKGRTIAIFMLAELPGMRDGAEPDLCLRIPAEMVVPLRDFLSPYAMLSRVVLEDARLGWRGFGLYGKRALTCAKTLWGDLPSAEGRYRHVQGQLLVMRDQDRLECWCQESSYQATLKDLLSSLDEEDEAHWSLADIRSGMADVYPSTSGQFIPQTLNLEAWRGISYTKGCYTGQEVIARMHHLGKSKRACVHASGTGSIPAPGDRIYDNAEKPCGEVVKVAPLPGAAETSYELLAVVQDQDNYSALHTVPTTPGADDTQSVLKVVKKFFPSAD